VVGYVSNKEPTASARRRLAADQKQKVRSQIVGQKQLAQLWPKVSGSKRDCRKWPEAGNGYTTERSEPVFEYVSTAKDKVELVIKLFTRKRLRG